MILNRRNNTLVKSTAKDISFIFVKLCTHENYYEEGVIFNDKFLDNLIMKWSMLGVRLWSYGCTREVGREAFEWHEPKPSASLAPRVLSQLRKCIHNTIDVQLKCGPFLLEYGSDQKG